MHANVIVLLEAVVQAGGYFCWENPPSSLALREPTTQAFLARNCKAWVVVTACSFGQNISKRWLLCTNWRPFAPLGKLCTHSGHPSLLGKDQSG